MDTLAFGYILPATGRIQDFHPLETCAARRTAEKAGRPAAKAGLSASFKDQFDFTRRQYRGYMNSAVSAQVTMDRII